MTAERSDSQECEIDAAVDAETDISPNTRDIARAASPLADHASGRTSERTVEGPDGAVQSSKVSKGLFGRRRNTKDSKEGKEQQVSNVFRL